MSLSGAIGDIQSKALTLGVKAAPNEPPESMRVFPFAVTYPKNGSFVFAGEGFGHYLHTIICEVHVARQVLGLAVAQAMPFVESFIGVMLGDPQLGGTVAGVNGLRYVFGKLEWGGEEHIGVRFEIDVKILEEV